MILKLVWEGIEILLSTFKAILTAHIAADVISNIYRYFESKTKLK